MTIGDGKARCIHCNLILSGDHNGPCPSCGKIGKYISVTSSGGLIAGGSSPIHTIRSYYEKNKIAYITNVIILVGSPFLGLFFNGLTGLLIGIIIGIVGYYLGIKAIQKVIEHKYYN